ncbi:MAG: putative rRNA maturation factor [Halioglobus sp.]|jgi:probable rRNA maturation factor
MSLRVDVQTATSEPVPEEGDIRSWIEAALSMHREDVELTVRLVDVAEMAELNESYRGKSGPTNVLSFPADLPAEVTLPLLGDIVICAPVVAREASAQHKPEMAHWAHMTVHGTLHLLGYDHLEEREAVAMEVLETEILARLNYPCPYAESPTVEQLQQ